MNFQYWFSKLQRLSLQVQWSCIYVGQLATNFERFNQKISVFLIRIWHPYRTLVIKESFFGMGIVCINRYSNNDTVVFPVNLFMCVLYQAKIKKTYLSCGKSETANCATTRPCIRGCIKNVTRFLSFVIQQNRGQTEKNVEILNLTYGILILML